MQNWFRIQTLIDVIHQIKRLKEKNHMITLINEEKEFAISQYPFMRKLSEKEEKKVTFST